jgi:hypothetical protein
MDSLVERRQERWPSRGYTRRSLGRTYTATCYQSASSAPTQAQGGLTPSLAGFTGLA